MFFHYCIEEHFTCWLQELLFLLWVFDLKKIWKFLKSHLLIGFLIVFDNLLHIKVFGLTSWKYFLCATFHMFAKSHKLIEGHKIYKLSSWGIHFILIIWFSLWRSFIFIRYRIKWPIYFFDFHFILIPLEWKINIFLYP